MFLAWLLKIFADWEVFVYTLEADRLGIFEEFCIVLVWALPKGKEFVVLDAICPPGVRFLLLKELFILFCGSPLITVGPLEGA